MPITKPGIQVKTYNSEQDLGLGDAFDLPLGGPGAQGLWTFPDLNGPGIREASVNADLGFPGAFFETPTAPLWQVPVEEGLEVGAGDGDYDLGLADLLGVHYQLGGDLHTDILFTLSPHPGALTEEPMWFVGTDMFEILTTEDGYAIWIG